MKKTDEKISKKEEKTVLRLAFASEPHLWVARSSWKQLIVPRTCAGKWKIPDVNSRMSECKDQYRREISNGLDTTSSITSSPRRQMQICHWYLCFVSKRITARVCPSENRVNFFHFVFFRGAKGRRGLQSARSSIFFFFFGGGGGDKGIVASSCMETRISSGCVGH